VTISTLIALTFGSFGDRARALAGISAADGLAKPKRAECKRRLDQMRQDCFTISEKTTIRVKDG